MSEFEADRPGHDPSGMRGRGRDLEPGRGHSGRGVRRVGIYDSIAMLETASRIQIKYGVVLSDEEVAEATSPRVLLHMVNRSLAETA